MKPFNKGLFYALLSVGCFNLIHFCANWFIFWVAEKVAVVGFYPLISLLFKVLPPSGGSVYA